MKFSVIFSTFMMAFLLTGTGLAQTSGSRLTFSESVDSSGKDIVVSSYSSPVNPGLRLFEGVVAGPVVGCFESYALSNVRPVSPDRASLSYDPATGIYTVKWVLKRDNSDTCRVLFASENGAVDAADYVIWRKTFGSTGFREENAKADDPDARSGDGSVRSVSHSISANVWY